MESREPRAKRVLVGVTGGIAAYKACDLVRELRHREMAVQVVLTPAAGRLVRPLTFSALTGKRALCDMFDEARGHLIDHIALGRDTDVVVVAPATADFLARLAHGMANDLLSALILALPQVTPVILVPAMNSRMWAHPHTQENVDRLIRLGRRGYNYAVLPPVAKELACGEYGAGALPPVEEIVAAVCDGS